MNTTEIPIISIVVCTYNRADVLAGALESLGNQALAVVHYEVIVVDNNSTDDTQEIIEKYCRKHENFRHLTETRQGLSHARNRGWQESRAMYIGYVDDDCQLPEDFLSVALGIIEKKSPTVFGGPSYAFYNTPKPQWYRDKYGSNTPYDEARRLSGEECVNIYGMNMFFRRSALETTGGFDPKFGMTGNKIAYSEETVLIMAITEAMADPLIYYDPDLYVYHLVQSERMQLKWIMRSSFAVGRSTFYYTNRRLPDQTHPVKIRYRLMRKGLRLLKMFVLDTLKSMFHRDRNRYPYPQNYLVESAFLHLYRLGVVVEQYTQINAHRSISQ